MDEDWEDSPAEPILKNEQPLKSKWDDEDVEEDEVKDSWEDDDAPALAPEPEPPIIKSASKSSTKAAGKKGTVDKKPVEEQLDPVADKLRQQRLVEESDYKSTAELFSKKSDEKSLDNFIPKSESDFMEYAELISHKLRPLEKSFHYISLLKNVARLSMVSLKAADAKEVASSVTAIANEKLKAEKEANAGKKKTGGKKKQLHMDKPDDDAAINVYDDADDFDFM